VHDSDGPGFLKHFGEPVRISDVAVVQGTPAHRIGVPGTQVVIDDWQKSLFAKRLACVAPDEASATRDDYAPPCLPLLVQHHQFSVFPLDGLDANGESNANMALISVALCITRAVCIGGVLAQPADQPHRHPPVPSEFALRTHGYVASCNNERSNRGFAVHVAR
jgi:hypothetical protein